MQITIKPIHHRGEEKLAIIFPFDKTVDHAVRSIKGIKWTQTFKCWYLPLSKESFETVSTRLKNIGELEYSVLKEYLEKRKKIVGIRSHTTAISGSINIKPVTLTAFTISDENILLLDQTIKTLSISKGPMR